MVVSYVMPKKDIWGWRYPGGAKLHLGTGSQGYRLNEDALAIIKLCNGKRTVNDIVKTLKKEKTLSDDDIVKIKQFVAQLVDKHILQECTQPATEEMDILMVGDDVIIRPVHCTVELCDSCNLRCNYCYRDAGPEKRKFLTHPIEFFADLYEQGIRVVELSGGEPLMHPQIREILDFAAQKLVLVGLLTNGVLLDEGLVDFIAAHSDKITLQVSVPSMKRERFAAITGADVWLRLRSNLLRLRNRNIRFRIGMVFHDEGAIQEMRDAAYFAKSLGALQFVCTPFVNLGRGRELSMSYETALTFGTKYQELQKELPPAFLGITEGELANQNIQKGTNCGAGSRCIVFDPDKKIRPCPMFPAEEFSNDALRNPELRARLSSVVAPNKQICGECGYFPYCSGCLLRGWIRHKEIDCPWAKSQNIDDLFAALKSSS